MYILWFSLGIVIGAAVVVGIEIALIWQLYVKPLREQREGKESHLPNEQQGSKDDPPQTPEQNTNLSSEQKKKISREWADAVVRFLRHSVGTGHEEESCVWLDVLLSRYFLELRRSDIYRNKLIGKFQTKIRQKLGSNEFVHDITVRDISFGERPPRVRKAQLLKTDPENEDLEVQVDLDVSYSGGAKVFLEVELAGDIFIPVAITVNGFAGKLRIRAPRPDNWRHFNMSFASNPGFQFEIEWKVVRGLSEYSMFKDRLNAYLEKKMVAAFLDLWVLPSWRFFDLPLINLPSKHPFCRCNLEDPTKNVPTELKESINDLFPLDVVVTPSNSAFLQSTIVSRLQFLVRDDKPSWHPLKSKSGISLQKLVGFSEPDVHRGSFLINFDAARVSKILMNPEHLKQVDEGYVWCTTVDKDSVTDSASIRHYGYKFNKTGYDFYVMDVIKKVETKGNSPPATVIVRRSVQAASPDPAGVGDQHFLRGLVHIYGYYIEPCVGDPTSCTVVCISQLGRGLEKLEITWKKLSLIKQLLERVLVLYDKRDRERKAKEVKPPEQGGAKGGEKEEKAKEPLPAEGSNDDKAKDPESLEKDEPDLRERSFTFPGSRLFFGDLRDDEKEPMSPLERRRSQIGILPTGSDDEDDSHPTPDDDNDPDDLEEETRTGGSKNTKVAGFPEVTGRNFKEVAGNLTTFFFENLYFDKEGEYAWRKIKEANGLTLWRKKADDGNSLDLVKGMVVINLPPSSVYDALRNERYFHLLHPDFLSCEHLEIFDSSISILYYIFKSTFFSDRDAVVLEVANKVESTPVPTWVVLQQSLTHPWVGKPRNKDQFPTRCDIFLSGYHIEGIQGKDGSYSSCKLTHISQVDGKFPVGVGGQFRFGWARNLEKFRTFVDKNPLTKRESNLPVSNLPPPPTQVTEATIKPGDVFAWAVTFDGKSPAHLEWDFDTQTSDIRWGLFLLPYNQKGEPETEKILLPYGRFRSNARPVGGKILLPPRMTKGKYIMRWDNRYSRFTGKRLRFQASLKYLSYDTPLEELHYQHMSGEVYIDALEIFRIPMTFTYQGGSNPHIIAHLVWDFKLASGSEIAFGILFKPSHTAVDENGKKKTEEEILVPSTKIRGTKDSIKGGIPITGNPGLYILTWDNSSSSWTSKNLVYTVSIRPEPLVDVPVIDDVIETMPLSGGES